ncbi:MAG: hypothetical protein Q9204_007636 [Flavoplaca sp. TL-2023a]
MAARTGRTPRTMRQREGNYEAPGVKGRATGITLAPRPIREDGMEETAGLFSSPEKSPPKPNGVSHDSTVIEQDEDETMNIGSSTIPEPTEVIKARNGKPILPPPKSRSPIKTSLGSAARRSLGPHSSPSRGVEQDTPTHRAMSNPPNRLLDFSRISESSVKGSVSKTKLSVTKGSKSKPSLMAGKRKRDLFDLPPDQDEEPVGGKTNLMNGTSLEDTYDDNQNMLDDNFDDSLQLPNGGDVSHTLDDQLPQDSNTISPSIEKDTTAPTKMKGKRGRPAASALAQVETVKPKSPSRRGRPPKKPRLEVPEVDAEVDAVEGATEVPIEEAAEPSKNPSQAQAAAMQPPKPKGGRGRQALALGDPNTKLQPRRRASRSASKGPMSPSKTRFITRSETPGDELSFRTTRAGRNVVKPLAFWRGESAVFGGGRLEEGNLVLPSIKEVIRTEEVPEPRRKKTPGQPRRRRKPARRPEDDELPVEEDEDEEYWETEAGVMRASVMLWDPATGRGDEEHVEEADVAYAAEAIEMRDINGADFRFAKTLTLPFFGSGMVDLPPGGTKRVKNSRKMQMVFFVFYGRVTVDLGTPAQRFSIGRGGMWQVPRGNFYAISNTSTKPARIFFAQGCEVAEFSAFDESGAA